jgi:PII-like signaling protein
MAIRQQAKLLRIFIGETDKLHGKPLYEAIIRAAQAAGLSGATVLRGIESYGASRRLHTAKVLRLSEDMPIVIEIVDGEEPIEQFLEPLNALLGDAGVGAMVTLEKVEILHYPPAKGK